MALSKKQLEKILIERYGALENAPKTKTPTKKYNKKLTEKIINKYPSLPKVESISMKRDRISTARNKFITAKRELEKLKKQFRDEINKTIKKALREAIFKRQNKLDDAKRKLYNATNKLIIKQSNLPSIPPAKDLKQDEIDAMARLERTLGTYSKGDMTITKFYHSYGFETVNKESLYAFVKAEGLA